MTGREASVGVRGPVPGARPELLRTLEAKAAPGRVALLIIDMSNDFLHQDGKTIAQAGRDPGPARMAVAPQRQLIDAAHDAHVPVVYIVHTTLPGGESHSGPWLEARTRAAYSTPDICIDGTWGQQVIDELAPTDGDLVIKKYRYSGFVGTNLDLVLRSLRIETVVCAGVSTNACVEATARDAFSHEYYVVIPEDACASWDMTLHAASLASASKRYAEVCSSEDLTALWTGS